MGFPRSPPRHDVLPELPNACHRTERERPVNRHGKHWWVFGISQQFLDSDHAQGVLPGPKELTDQMRRGVHRVSEGEPWACDCMEEASE